jgi:acetyl-CoA carboxylase carboxyltransferase component
MLQLGAAKATLTHFTVMPSDIGSLFAAGPPVVTPATHETVTKAQLGGPLIHCTNGSVDNPARDEIEALQMIQRFLGYLPSNRWTMPPFTNPAEPESDPADPYALLRVIPESNTKPYDPLAYLSLLADAGTIFEIGPMWGQEIRTYLARFGGMPVAVLCGDPRFTAGAIGAKACDKICRWDCEHVSFAGVEFVGVFGDLSEGLKRADNVAPASTAQGSLSAPKQKKKGRSGPEPS